MNDAVLVPDAESTARVRRSPSPIALAALISFSLVLMLTLGGFASAMLVGDLAMAGCGGG